MQLETLYIMSVLTLSFFFSLLLSSYIYMKDITTLHFSIHLSRSLGLAKSLIQASKTVALSSPEKNQVYCINICC